MLDQGKALRVAGDGFTSDATASHAPIGRFYTDPKIFEAEQEWIFQREWQYFCHQSQVPKSGDYLVGDVGGQSIYVIRGKDKEIRSFYNVCRHRGHQLLAGQGNAKLVVRCPYHSWTYDFEGKLRSAPKCEAVEGFEKDGVKLSSIQVEIVAGFVFVNLDPEAKSLREVAPDFEAILLSMVAEAPDLKYAKHKEYDLKANWKVVTENFLEAYHVAYSGTAHTALGNLIDIDTYRFNIDGRTIEYTARGGEVDVIPYNVNENEDFTNTRDAPFHQVFLWPNMTFSVFPGTNMLFVFSINPAGPERTAEEIAYFTLDGTMTEPTETAEAYVSDKLNPEDVELVEGVQRGMHSKGYKPGRLMVDPEKREAWGEHFIHHFNSLNVAALENADLN